MNLNNRKIKNHPPSPAPVNKWTNLTYTNNPPTTPLWGAPITIILKLVAKPL